MVFIIPNALLANVRVEPEYKETGHIGIWVEDIYNIYFSTRTYDSVFLVWTNSNSDTFDFMKYTDFNNSIEASVALKYSTKIKDGRIQSESKVKVKFLNKYDVRVRFPFTV